MVGISLQSHVKSWGQENPFKWFEKIRHFCHYQLEFYMFTPFTPFCWFMSTYESTTAVIIIWQFLMFYQILLSLQVKQSKITSNKYGIWDLPHELPNDFRLRKYLENLKFHRIIVFQNKNFVNTSKKLVKNRSWTFPTVHYFTRKLQPVSNIPHMDAAPTITQVSLEEPHRPRRNDKKHSGEDHSKWESDSDAPNNDGGKDDIRNNAFNVFNGL